MNDEALSLWRDSFIQCISGLPLTLSLTFISLLIGACMALPLSVVHARKTTFGARLARIFTFLFTGTPLLVQV